MRCGAVDRPNMMGGRGFRLEQFNFSFSSPRPSGHQPLLHTHTVTPYLRVGVFEFEPPLNLFCGFEFEGAKCVGAGPGRQQQLGLSPATQLPPATPPGRSTHLMNSSVPRLGSGDVRAESSWIFAKYIKISFFA